MSDPKKRPGRPKFVPTPQQRRQVLRLAAQGMTMEEMAALIDGPADRPISLDTFRAAFRDEVQKGRSSGMRFVTRTLLYKAVKGDNFCISLYVRRSDAWMDAARKKDLMGQYPDLFQAETGKRKKAKSGFDVEKFFADVLAKPAESVES